MSDIKTATERLREMLDERGVEYTTGASEVCGSIINRTIFGTTSFHERGNGDNLLEMRNITPEQAIAATVGSDDARAADYWHRMFDEHMRECATLGSGERTCFADEVTHRDCKYSVNRGWKERTCRDMCASVSEFTCSACGFNCDLTSWISMFDGDEGRHRHHHYGTPNYCPNCGCKVVSK